MQIVTGEVSLPSEKVGHVLSRQVIMTLGWCNSMMEFDFWPPSDNPLKPSCQLIQHFSSDLGILAAGSCWHMK